jgi:glucose/mannose-6-phosphate isomerase
MAEDFEDLDSPTTYAVDPSGVYGWIEKWDSQLEDGSGRYVGKIDLRDLKKAEISEVIVCGMGGSAIAGDVAFAAVREMVPVPCGVVRGYVLPLSLGKSTLQIVVSYSGDTEESISAYTQGHNRGAKVVVVASGGALKDVARHHGCPCIELPPDCLAPRTALGYLLTAVLGVLMSAFDEVHGLEEMIGDAVTSLKRGLKRFERDLPFEKNQTKQLAHDIHGVFPVVVGTELTFPAALRFQAQLNENSKWPCHASKLPEMNHNEVVAYSQPGPATKRTGIIMLLDEDDHPRTQARQNFTIDLLEQHVAWVGRLKGEGKGSFARLINLIQAADFTSYYLACGRGLDPRRIRAIDELKDRMGKVQ